MKNMVLPGTDLDVSRVAIGCMRIADKNKEEANKFINTALEYGYNFFDNADIYGGGLCEKILGEGMKLERGLREKMVIQSKCGIRKSENGISMFDFSKDHILKSVDGILERLQTDYLDLLVLHRPDTLVEPEEVAEAFTLLEKQGKVKYFGVSNQNPYQIELLQKYCKQKIVVNQLQLSITNSGMIDAGFNVNMENNLGINRDGSVLDYCRLKDITIQTWSPFQYGFFEGTFIGSEKYPELNKVLNEIAEKYGITVNAVAIAWILRHSAKMQAIIGTTNIERIKGIAKAPDIELTREEWYKIYLSVGKVLP